MLSLCNTSDAIDYCWDTLKPAQAREYIIGLKNASGDLMYTTHRKTGFAGFFVAIDSIKSIFF
jgi:hypothetical protein